MKKGAEKNKDKDRDKNMEEEIQQLKKLSRLLAEKQKLLEEIFRLSRRQGEYIQNEEIEKLEEVLESKEVRMDRINRLDGEFLQIFQQIKADHMIEDLGELDVEKKYLSELQRAAALVTDSLEKIAGLDRQNQELAESGYLDLKGRLKKINRGKRVRVSYNQQPSTAEGIYLDKKH